MNARKLIDTDRYPLHLQGTKAFQELVEHCRRALKQQGACMLPGFTTPEATICMAEETDRIIPDAFACRDLHNVYLEKDDDTFEENHPRRQVQATDLDVIAFDQIDAEDGLHLLYHYDPLLNFIASVIETNPYYRMADPLAALTINVMQDGHKQGWHFDEAEVTTTLMIRKPDAGGAFEYIQNIRTNDVFEYEQVNLALNDKHPEVRTLNVEPGTLLIFAGYYSLHRVTSLIGRDPRYVATLCYKDQPNMCNSPEVQKLFYGRTAL
jgi:hypothetical protein